jgi:Rps23 Pro-64 3,4-dihydroxylase Tpa1-like proline 4-hydroxylase
MLIYLKIRSVVVIAQSAFEIFMSTVAEVLSKNYLFTPEKLDKLAEEYHESFLNAKPFPFVSIDNFLPEELLTKVLEEFPGPDQIKWDKYEYDAQIKLASSKEEQMGPFTRFLLYQLNSSTFIQFLEKLSGIEGLVPDPHLWGGGLHQIKPQGFLKVHADFNFHPVLKLDRRLNILIYLNKDWEDSYGGELQLWDRDVKQCEARIKPVFNRFVVFNTNDFTFHGHPEPLNCPPDRTRKSLALYYYSNGRPESEVNRNSETNWRKTPGETTSSDKVKQTISRFIPPIIMDWRNKRLAAKKNVMLK